MHSQVAYQIVLTLAGRDLLRPGLLYGSAYSGIDLFAAAVEQ